MSFFGFIIFVQTAANPVASFLPLIAIVAIFYFLVFMPMQKQKKQTQEMQSSLKNGTIVLTSGGIVGTIVTIGDDETLIIRVKPDNLKLQVARNSVTGVIPQ